MNTACDGEEFLRFLELHEERGDHRLSTVELQEYQWLLERYHGDAGADADGPGNPARAPSSAGILSDEWLAIPGDEPLICPRSRPQLPSELLPRFEQRCRELGQIGRGETVLWIGRGISVMAMCMWDCGCECFGASERLERLGIAAGLLVRDVRLILRAPVESEGFARAMISALDYVRVLAPLTAFYKSQSGPDFPPRDLALAFVGLSGAVVTIRGHFSSEDSSVTGSGRTAELLEVLEGAVEAFLAEACGAWPGLAGGSGSSLPPAADCDPCAPPVAAKAPASCPLTFEPGAFVYRNRRQPLSGKPLQVLEALAKAKGNVLTLAALRDLCWQDDLVGEETIRSAVKEARAALRGVIPASGAECGSPFDPIAVVDRGVGRTAWRLSLP
jgi:hypothetical protein